MKPQYTPIEHSLEFSRRRRALFPSNENSVNGSGLGCISPLVFESDDVEAPSPNNPSFGDYDIIGLVDKDNTVNTPVNSVPYPVSKLATPQTDASPTQNLRTPHDIPNNKLPKLPSRKPFTDDDHLNQDNFKTSKVRTALFPDSNMPISRKKNQKKAKHTLFLCNHKGKSKSGQINAGVRHKIRKPAKKRSLHKTAALRAALNANKNDLLKGKQIVAPEPPKKVFKTPSPQTKGVISFNNNIKFELVNGKMCFTVNKNKLKRSAPQEPCLTKRLKLDVPIFDEGKPIESNAISNIIESLEDKENRNKSVVGLMSPTSLMCNMTSGLALNSPKKVMNLSPILDKMSTSPAPNHKKLFPIFYPDIKHIESSSKSEIVKNPAKRFRPIAKDQMLLDVGQKRWGVTQCNECKFVYHMGDPNDEIIHLNYHNAEHIFRFNGWKNERVVTNSLLDGKVVQVVPGDPKVWWKKVKEVIEVVNRDLGFYDMVFNTEKSQILEKVETSVSRLRLIRETVDKNVFQIFFYIKNRIIIGVLVAEVISSAHCLLTTSEDQVDLCSEESYPVKCGISRIWVSQLNRKKGIATAMMEALRRNFVMGYILKTEDIAFSSPTALGKIFGKQYFKTENFFIYFM